jgi:hypothetical protein
MVSLISLSVFAGGACWWRCGSRYSGIIVHVCQCIKTVSCAQDAVVPAFLSLTQGWLCWVAGVRQVLRNALLLFQHTW